MAKDKNNNVIIDYFDEPDKADDAADSLKAWDKQNKDVDLGGIAILTWQDGKIKTRKVGTRQTGKGAGWGTALGAAVGVLSGDMQHLDVDRLVTGSVAVAEKNKAALRRCGHRKVGLSIVIEIRGEKKGDVIGSQRVRYGFLEGSIPTSQSNEQNAVVFVHYQIRLSVAVEIRGD